MPAQKFFLSRCRCLATAAAGILLACGSAVANHLVKEEIDWPAFLARHDLLWEQLPLQWNEGAFTGNGNLGFVTYVTLKDNRVDFHLGRADVTDHRLAPDRRTSLGVPGASVMWDFPRLDIGRMVLRPAGKIQDGTMRMDLWNAEITGTIQTDLGELRFRALTLRDRMVHMIEIESTEKDANGRPAPWNWEFLPGNPVSSRAIVRPREAIERGYETNPDPELTEIDGVPVCVQPLLAGGDYATAWLETPRKKGATASRLFISTANEVPESGRSGPEAVREVKAAAGVSVKQLETEHRAWWHDFYRRAFLTIPSPLLESFYWIQIYKLGAAIRPDGPALDNLGPFYRMTQWPGLWWNLNVQLSYWPVYAGNRLELGESFMRLIDENFDALLEEFSTSKKTKIGDFIWALHNYWWQLRFEGDWKGVVERWKPKAKATFAAFEPRLIRNEEGQLEIEPMGSPEYHGFKAYPHTNYNLALVRWLLNSMLEADARAGGEPDPDAEKWRQILAELAPYPVDENGLRIAKNQAVDESHRHFSHLLALHPLFQLNPDDPKTKELVDRSVRHWHAVENGKGLAGYSYTGGAALYATLGLGDEALGMLDTFTTEVTGISLLHANTLYFEDGGKNPVIETPLSGASAIMDLLLQSWGGKIRVFPAIPSAWKDAAFNDLRAIDAFLVSAERKDGSTRWVAIESLAGEPCVLKVRDWEGPLDVRATGRVPAITPLGKGEYRIDLRKGESVLLSPKGSAVSARVHPLDLADPSAANPYGVKRGKEIRGDQFWPEPPIPWTPPSP